MTLGPNVERNYADYPSAEYHFAEYRYSDDRNGQTLQLIAKTTKKKFYETLATEVPVKISLKSPTVSPSFEQSVKVNPFFNTNATILRQMTPRQMTFGRGCHTQVNQHIYAMP